MPPNFKVGNGIIFSTDDFNKDFQKPELANTVYDLDQKRFLEILTPFDINSIPIIFEEDIDACCTDTCSTSIPSGAINEVLELTLNIPITLPKLFY